MDAARREATILLLIETQGALLDELAAASVDAGFVILDRAAFDDYWVQRWLRESVGDPDLFVRHRRRLGLRVPADEASA